MNCDDFAEAISALADGTLDAAERPRVEAHLEACADCRQLFDDLRSLRREASALPVEPLPASLWPRIAARLRDQGMRADDGGHASGQRRALWQWAAIAALLVIAVGAGLLVTWSRRPATPVSAGGSAPHSDSGVTPASKGNSPPPGSVQGIEMELRMAEEHYEKAISGLQQVANSERSSLDPQVAATVKRNLEVIDQAIAESRTALKTEPQSQPARESLFDALRRKIVLLQDTLALMNEMRKGNQAGAAQIVEGNKS